MRTCAAQNAGALKRGIEGHHPPVVGIEPSPATTTYRPHGGPARLCAIFGSKLNERPSRPPPARCPSGCPTITACHKVESMQALPIPVGPKLRATT